MKCPICGDFLFSTETGSLVCPLGHAIHEGEYGIEYYNPVDEEWKIIPEEEKMSRKFACFIETNEWESEQWRFYIPVHENAEAIQLLTEKLASLKKSYEKEHIECPYSLDSAVYSETEVDSLVFHSGSGYLRFHNKMDTLLDPDRIREKLSAPLMKGTHLHNDPLYKGGIRDFFILPSQEG